MGRKIITKTIEQLKVALVAILADLNETQRQVAEHNDGAAMMAAVAGSGKTHTVCAFVLNQICKGRDPERMLLSTFSKAGAEEMNDRLRDRYGVKIRKIKGDGGVRVGTLHSVALEIVRDGSPWASYEVDAGDRMKYKLKDLLGWRGMKWSGADLTKVIGFIAGCKNSLINPMDAEHPDRRYVEAYSRYEDERHASGLLTFDDMTGDAVRFLKSDPDALLRWQGRYDVVVLDEFQDTNVAQMELVRLLAAKAEVFLVVGDDDQLIYGFRGSLPEHMISFEQEFDAKVYRAEQNYRSRPGILDAANKVIVNNDPHRVPKTNRPVRTEPAAVEFEACADMDAEAESVCERVRALLEEDCAPQDIAILYRTNAQSRAFEEQFIAHKIPHVVIGGTQFYKRKEVADVLAYIRLAMNRNNNTAFKRAVNRPFRFIGKVSVEAIEDFAGNGSMLDAARDNANNIGLRQSRQVDSLLQFCSLVDDVRDRLHGGPNGEPTQELSQVLAHIIKVSGYERWIIEDEGTDTSENSRLSNLRELVRTANRFKTAEEFIDFVDETTKAISKRNDGEREAVQLMTIHKSKGMEFPTVFVVGAAEGILPHARCENMQDERRLFYVAVTRARDRLVVTSPLGAWVGDRIVQLNPSIFTIEAGLTSEDRLDNEQVI